MTDNIIVSPIAIDMGAKNTGVYLNHFTEGEDPSNNPENIFGFTAIIDSNKITWSQKNRTSKRHQIRNSKRKKLSKRLLKVILGNEFDIRYSELPQKQVEYINGLLNRRGYTYLSEELDKDLIKLPLVANYFVEHHSDHFQNIQTFEHDFIELANDLSKCKDLFSKLILGKNEVKKQIDEDTETKQILADAYENIQKTLENQIKSEKDGHYRRKDYFENIKKDIDSSETLEPIYKNSSLTRGSFFHLVANISNLQLKPLRKYFNDKEMISGDCWRPEKLQKIYFRWIRSYRAKLKNDIQNKKSALENSDKNIIEVLTTMNPEWTIPPYEDQDNRIKESIKDKTLRLNATQLEKQFPNWKTFTENILRINPSLENNVKTCTHFRISKVKNYNFELQCQATILQRILDRSKIFDPYKLRTISQISDFKNLDDELQKGFNELTKHLKNNKNHVSEFLKLAKKYYQEVETAKQGLWTDNENTLFFCCNTNPPHKSKLKNKNVGSILQRNLSSKDLEQFIHNCWESKVGRNKVKSLCKKVEDTRKKYGNAFNFLKAKLGRFNWSLENKRQELNDEQIQSMEHFIDENKEIQTAIENTILAVDSIANYLGHDETQRMKYQSPFSMAQLYNILEGSISGFSNTDKYNTEENSWRMQMNLVEDKAYANAVRLTADSVRPFDGMLARILSRQAYEISQTKLNQLKQLDINPNDELLIPIFLEQNKFKFEKDLHEIKGKSNVAKKTQKRVEEGFEQQEKHWQDKSDRIKSASHNLCPYTGSSLSTQGQLDHIVPQAQSRKNRNQVFNSEANLIYCSTKGNTDKSDRRYTLSNLNSAYLSKVFPNQNIESVKTEITQFVESIDENNFSGFHNLTDDDQKRLRHALFIPELDYKTFALLNTRYKTLVNGTQAYLAKLLVKNLRVKYPNAEFKVYQISAEEVQQTRNNLSVFNNKFEKEDTQSAFSHVIDASMVFATALQNPQISNTLRTISIVKEHENGEWLSKIVPNSLKVQVIDRKPKYRKELKSTQIFKEGIYAERFVPIILNQGKMYKGFSIENCIEIKSKQKQTYEQLKNFLCLPTNYFSVEDNFETIQELSNTKPVYLSFNRKNSIAYLQTAYSIGDDEKIKIANLLSSFRYSTKKVEIKKELLTGTGSKKFIKSLNDKSFKIFKNINIPVKQNWLKLIKTPIKNYQGKLTTLEKCFGKNEMAEIDTDIANDFYRKIDSYKNNTELRELLISKNKVVAKAAFEKSLKENYQDDHTKTQLVEDFSKYLGEPLTKKMALIPEDSWDQLFKQFFHNKKQSNQSAHKQVRKIYSLPKVDNASGGFRAKRFNSVYEEDIYQLSSIEGFSTRGFDTNLKNPALISQIEQSNNLSPTEKYETIKDVVYFDEWRNINIPEKLAIIITGLQYCIGSKDRFYTKICMPIEKFKEFVQGFNSWTDLPFELKENKKGDSWVFKKSTFAENFDSKLIAKPRSNLFIYSANSKEVQIFYIVESTNTDMKNAFIEAT